MDPVIGTLRLIIGGKHFDKQVRIYPERADWFVGLGNMSIRARELLVDWLFSIGHKGVSGNKLGHFIIRPNDE